MAHHFTSCLDVYLNGGDHGATAPTGKYTIYPNGGAAVDIYCDMSDTGGWTKFLQYNSMYTPNSGAVGTISGPGGVSGNPAANAKLSDADINAIGGKAFYVRFVMGTTTRSIKLSSLSDNFFYAVSCCSSASRRLNLIFPCLSISKTFTFTSSPSSKISVPWRTRSGAR